MSLLGRREWGCECKCGCARGYECVVKGHDTTHSTVQHKYQLDIQSSERTHLDARDDWDGWLGGGTDVVREKSNEQIEGRHDA